MTRLRCLVIAALLSCPALAAAQPAPGSDEPAADEGAPPPTGADGDAPASEAGEPDEPDESDDTPHGEPPVTEAADEPAADPPAESPEIEGDEDWEADVPFELGLDGDGGATPADHDELLEDAESIENIEDLDLASLLAIQVVEAASWRPQSIHDAPSAVTLIDGDAIRRLGVTNVGDAMRLVPGMHVIRQTANDYVLGMRSASAVTTDRVLVLLDGRVAVDWTNGFSPFAYMPLHPDELERVEVLRGPGTTLYGANAFGGVISLVTRSPLDHPGLEGSFSGGLLYLTPEDGEASRVNQGGTGYLAYNYANDSRTFGARFSAGYGSTPEWEPPATEGPLRRGQFRYYLNASAVAEPCDTTRLRVRFTHSDTEQYTVTGGNPALATYRGAGAVVARATRSDRDRRSARPARRVRRHAVPHTLGPRRRQPPTPRAAAGGSDALGRAKHQHSRRRISRQRHPRRTDARRTRASTAWSRSKSCGSCPSGS